MKTATISLISIIACLALLVVTQSHANQSIGGSMQIGYDTAACAAAKQGTLRYSSSTTNWDYCNGSAWTPFRACKGGASCPDPGDVCTDGSVFIGCPFSTYTPTYTTRCDAGQTWSGSACTGTRSTLAWNAGNGAGFTTTSITSVTDGEANTNSLIALDSNSGTAGTQQHLAAQYCYDLSIHSQTDWYLPSPNELMMLYISQASLDGVNAAGSYWTSAERDNDEGRVLYFGLLALSYVQKDNAYNVRCMRQ